MEKFIDKRIGVLIEQLGDHITPVRLKLNGWNSMKCGYKHGNTVPSGDADGWDVFGENQIWGTQAEEHRWFYKHIEIPAELKGRELELYVSVKPSCERRQDSEAQFIAYINGRIVRGLDFFHPYLKLDSNADSCDVHIYAYSMPHGARCEFFAELCEFDREVEKLYYDLSVPFEMFRYMHEEEKEYRDICYHLNNALNLLNWNDPGSEEFKSSVRAADRYMDEEFYGKYCRESDIKVSCIGHTHIDVAWKWTLGQTREKVQRTFGSVVEMMKKYPDYKFMTSQPQLLKYLKEESPEIYADIKRLVAEGRIELEGSMWLEADCNLASGESFVRQFMFGKRFFRDEFGVENHLLWLPDVFGYSAALPQIMQKSGVTTFVTSKLSWNETNRMPYDTFMWRGIDGTEVFTYFLTAARREKFDTRPNWSATYTPNLEPGYIRGVWNRYEPKAITEEVLMPFGHGDGGGGPADIHIEHFNRLKYGIRGCPQVRWEFASTFLDRLYNKVKDDKRLPKWSGELYFELHRGTYTSQARNKRSNRKSEQLYQNTEMISSMANRLVGAEYRRDELNEGWECILLNQFHDIIPGSSIHSVYEDSKKDYEKIRRIAESVADDAYAGILSGIGTDGGTVVFNMNSFESNGFLNHNGKTYRVSAIPPKGYKVVKLSDAGAAHTFDGRRMETSNYSVEFGEDYTITRLYDKINGRDVLRKGGRANYLEAFEDFPKEYDAWEITEYYDEKKYEISDVDSVEFIDEGARFGLEITRKFYNSLIKQKIYFYDGSPRIDFDTYVDWHQEHTLVKAAFDVDVNSDKATFEIQFGSVERAVHKNTSWDKARFEVCAHKFIDYSDYGYGVSLLNDCKYGHNIDNGTMKISLLKCATWPDEDADKGEHSFIYSIVPHAGSFKEAGVINEAYELNYPLRAFDIGSQSGKLPEEYSLVSCSADSFIVETVKAAEDSDATVVRGYESFNKRTDVSLRFGFDVHKAYLCGLMEDELEELEVHDNRVDFTAKPFEIITVKVY